MMIICDTHALLYWADRPERLSAPASEAMDAGRAAGSLAAADISLWEISMLFARGRLVLPTAFTVAGYLDDLRLALGLHILPITPAIAALAESGAIPHGDPADRLIAATALHHRASLVTRDEKLRALPGLVTIW